MSARSLRGESPPHANARCMYPNVTASPRGRVESSRRRKTGPLGLAGRVFWEYPSGNRRARIEEPDIPGPCLTGKDFTGRNLPAGAAPQAFFGSDVAGRFLGLNLGFEVGQFPAAEFQHHIDIKIFALDPAVDPGGAGGPGGLALHVAGGHGHAPLG